VAIVQLSLFSFLFLRVASSVTVLSPVVLNLVYHHIRTLGHRVAFPTYARSSHATSSTVQSVCCRQDPWVSAKLSRAHHDIQLGPGLQPKE